MLHLGAFTATIMTANVFFVIMPNQRIVVADLKAGRPADPKYGKIAKLRSTHNNYLTLPVVFLMLSNHYPLAFATEYNWVIAGLIFLMGVTIRHFFNTMHAGGGMRRWTWAVTTILFVIVMWLSTAPMFRQTLEEAEARVLTPTQQAMVDVAGWDDAYNAVMGRCSMCHAREPSYEASTPRPRASCWRPPTTSPAPRAKSISSRRDRRHAARQCQLHGAAGTAGDHRLVSQPAQDLCPELTDLPPPAG